MKNATILTAIVIMGLLAMLVGYTSWSDFQHKEKLENFTRNYIVVHPESVSLINRYNDCVYGKESAVEGCIEHVAKNENENSIITQYWTELYSN